MPGHEHNLFGSLVVTAVAATAFAGTASAEVGKRVSVATGATGTIVAYPSMTDAVTVAVPASYKSKANFLKVTASYSESCSSGDYTGSKIDVGGVEMVDNSLPFEASDEDASSQIVTKLYYLVPENQGGPTVPPASMVTMKITSGLGTGCYVSNVTLTVEASK
jgi:hypothetical protein